MTTTPDPRHLARQTFPALLDRNAARFGDRTAQLWREGNRVETRTYAELHQIVSLWAAGLMSLGVAKGDRVGIMAATGPRWMWADYAILRCGGITVTLYPTLRRDEAGTLIADAGLRLLFVGDLELAERLADLGAGASGLESRILLDASSPGVLPPGIIDGSALTSLGRAYLSAHPEAVERRRQGVVLSDPMTIVYTSGTTGVPKGVVHTHASMNAACIRDILSGPPIRPDDLLLSFLPLAHTFERQCGHGVAMQAAIPIAYSSPATLLHDVQVFRPTFFLSVPRMYERIYRALQERAAGSRWKHLVFDLSLQAGRQAIDHQADRHGFIEATETSTPAAGLPPGLRVRYLLADRILFRRVRAMFGGRLRFAFSAAGSLPAELCKTFWAMGIRIYEGYGATETCNTVSLNPPDRVLPGSIGRLCPGMAVRTATDGEWLVRGETLFAGYWNNSDATRRAFDEDGYYRTGDIVEEVADGFYRLVDRKRGMMVLDTGKNVPSAKIERLFSLTNYVQLVVPMGDNRKFVAAVIVPNFGRCLEQFDLQGIPYRRDQVIWESGELGTLCVGVGPDVAGHPFLRRLIDNEVQAANRRLAEYEQIKAYILSPRVLSAERGEITPTLKVRRHAVYRSFQADIDALYA